MMNYIDINSSEYPYLLRQIKDPPPKLYFKKDWNTDIFSETLSVVGSRKMTRYGEQITDKLITAISGAGITIVSGFMYGIDAQAHNAAVKTGGRTIAVMPCGIDRIHPEYQIDLYNSILKNKGLIVSEYPGDTPPALWTYPRRNRIIAGLSPVLLVIEAGIKSGALITAKIAKKYNKIIYAVPGPMLSSVSQGTNMLIKQGAQIVTSKQDILSEYGITSKNELFSKKETYGLNKTQVKILKLLSNEPMGIDDIARISKKNISDIGADITVLSIKKHLSLNEGKYYIRSGGENVI
ncbi:MAG: DNA-protecting protein DprA [Spirochaetes bacterium]|nr:MAG: DNA-protecting protein DprA [Spirochaetota bacterium]